MNGYWLLKCQYGIGFTSTSLLPMLIQNGLFRDMYEGVPSFDYSFDKKVTPFM
jgi:hypothetical protein